MRAALAALVDLVLPASCAGCGAPGGVLCRNCCQTLREARPSATRPLPSPQGMPRTAALASYAGPLRMALLTYKERGRYCLATILGTHLADVITHLVGPLTPPLLLLIPIPTTAEAIRRRRVDHMAVLSRVAVRALRRKGWRAALARPLLTATSQRADSATLTAAQRRAAARGAFRTRRRAVRAIETAVRAGAVVVLVDDIVTTGSTLAAAAETLRGVGVSVTGAAVLAATMRRT